MDKWGKRLENIKKFFESPKTIEAVRHEVTQPSVRKAAEPSGWNGLAKPVGFDFKPIKNTKRRKAESSKDPR